MICLVDVFVTSILVPKNLQLMSVPSPSQRNRSMHPSTVMIVLPLLPTSSVPVIAVGGGREKERERGRERVVSNTSRYMSATSIKGTHTLIVHACSPNGRLVVATSNVLLLIYYPLKIIICD